MITKIYKTLRRYLAIRKIYKRAESRSKTLVFYFDKVTYAQSAICNFDFNVASHMLKVLVQDSFGGAWLQVRYNGMGCTGLKATRLIEHASTVLDVKKHQLIKCRNMEPSSLACKLFTKQIPKQLGLVTLSQRTVEEVQPK